MRRFAVIGLGNFGMSLALELARLGQRVIAIDSDPEKARDAQPHVDLALVADATERDNLVAMGVEKVDVAAVSLGRRMDATLLVVLHLTRLGVPEIVAKAANEDHAELLDRVGATRVVFPEKEMAHRVAERMSSQTVLDYLSLSSGFKVVELAPTREFVGKSLAELDLGRRYGVQVLAVKELVPERISIAPSPAHVFKDSDILVVMGTDEAVKKLREV
ncbi:MAG: TrkA family potassium uptake protein [Deferrisomatales bacterium]